MEEEKSWVKMYRNESFATFREAIQDDAVLGQYLVSTKRRDLVYEAYYKAQFLQLWPLQKSEIQGITNRLVEIRRRKRPWRG